MQQFPWHEYRTGATKSSIRERHALGDSQDPEEQGKRYEDPAFQLRL